jgi:hypothetical protein
VTLARLALAWLAVGAWFLVAGWAARRWVTGGAAVPSPWTTALEAAAVTLFASLWFDSLGHGGWWLLFLLVGALAAFAPRLSTTAPAPTSPRRAALFAGLADVARYVGAGALLAWRLS